MGVHVVIVGAENGIKGAGELGWTLLQVFIFLRFLDCRLPFFALLDSTPTFKSKAASKASWRGVELSLLEFELVVPSIMPTQVTRRTIDPIILKTRARPPNLPDLEPPGVGYGKTYVVKQKDKTSFLVVLVKYVVLAFLCFFLHTHIVIFSLEIFHGTLRR
jgi:hypothetical protein